MVPVFFGVFVIAVSALAAREVYQLVRWVRPRQAPQRLASRH